jgi:hypothetical protein
MACTTSRPAGPSRPGAARGKGGGQQPNGAAAQRASRAPQGKAVGRRFILNPLHFEFFENRQLHGLKTTLLLPLGSWSSTT